MASSALAGSTSRAAKRDRRCAGGHGAQRLRGAGTRIRTRGGARGKRRVSAANRGHRFEREILARRRKRLDVPAWTVRRRSGAREGGSALWGGGRRKSPD